MKEITTFKQLCEWLYENDYFSHGHVLDIDYDPLSITIGKTIKVNGEAYTEKHILTYKLIPKNLLEWSIPNGFIPADEYFIEGFEAIEMDGGVAIKSSSPDISIIAKSFKISYPEIIQVTLKPWVSEINQADCVAGD
jgi:hypothetical protein